MCNVLTGAETSFTCLIQQQGWIHWKHIWRWSLQPVALPGLLPPQRQGFFIIFNFPEGASSHSFSICTSRGSDLCLKEQSVPSQKGLLAHRLAENWESALLNISGQLSLLWPQFSSLLFSEVIFQLGFLKGLGFYLFGVCFGLVFLSCNLKLVAQNLSEKGALEAAWKLVSQIYRANNWSVFFKVVKSN